MFLKNGLSKEQIAFMLSKRPLARTEVSTVSNPDYFRGKVTDLDQSYESVSFAPIYIEHIEGLTTTFAMGCIVNVAKKGVCLMTCLHAIVKDVTSTQGDKFETYLNNKLRLYDYEGKEVYSSDEKWEMSDVILGSLVKSQAGFDCIALAPVNKFWERWAVPGNAISAVNAPIPSYSACYMVLPKEQKVYTGSYLPPEDPSWIMHSCSTKPGDSGCPVFDSSVGKIIGVHFLGIKTGGVNVNGCIPMSNLASLKVHFL